MKIILTSFLLITFIIAILSCSKEDNFEPDKFRKRIFKEVICDHEELLSCWNVSEIKCVSAVNLSIDYCFPIKAKLTYEYDKDGMYSRCISDKLNSILEIDDEIEKSCRHIKLSRE